MVLVRSSGLSLHCELGALVAPSGTGVEALSEMKEREGSPEDLRDLALLLAHPHGAPKAVHVLLFHVATGFCCPSRRRMSSSYAMPVPMANVVGSMVGLMRTLSIGIESSSCMGQGDPGSDHGEAGLTLNM